MDLTGAGGRPARRFFAGRNRTNGGREHGCGASRAV